MARFRRRPGEEPCERSGESQITLFFCHCLGARRRVLRLGSHRGPRGRDPRGVNEVNGGWVGMTGTRWEWRPPWGPVPVPWRKARSHSLRVTRPSRRRREEWRVRFRPETKDPPSRSVAGWAPRLPWAEGGGPSRDKGRPGSITYVHEPALPSGRVMRERMWHGRIEEQRDEMKWYPCHTRSPLAPLTLRFTNRVTKERGKWDRKVGPISSLISAPTSYAHSIPFGSGS